MRILVVEDNHRLSYELKQSLMHEGYAVDTVYDGDAGVIYAESAPYDAIILDILLPVKDGLEVCHTLRKQGCTIPILMLTARDATDDRVRGWNHEKMNASKSVENGVRKVDAEGQSPRFQWPLSYPGS